MQFLNLGANLVDEYKINKGEGYLDHPWSNLVNEFTPQYYKYLEECAEKNEPTDLRIISNLYLLPFIENAMNIRQVSGYDNFGSRTLVNLSSYIRKRINELEVNCVYYAENIEKQYTEYFSSENENSEKLKIYKKLFDDIQN